MRKIINPIRDSSSSGRAYIISRIFEDHKKLFVVSENREESEILVSDLETFGRDIVRFYENPKEISETLLFLKEGKRGIIATDRELLSVGIKDVREYGERVIFKEGMMGSPQSFSAKLVSLGFEKSDFVFERGKFSVRGSILDFWDFAGDAPVRVDFGVSQIEKIKFFDSESQRSTGTIRECCVFGNPLGKSKILSFLPRDFEIVLPDTVTINLKGFNKFVFTPSGEDMGIRRAPVYSGQLEIFLEDLRNFQKNDFSVAFFCESEESLEYIKGIVSSKVPLKASYYMKPLSGGIVDWKKHRAFLKSGEIFGVGTKVKESGIFPRRHPKRDIIYRKGDFLVHTDYGIGEFLKLSRFEIKGKDVDYITIKYADGLAHIPLEEFSKVHKWRASSGVKPVLSRLSTKEFEARKKKVSKEAMRIAAEILKVGAKRRKIEGISFAPLPAERAFAGQFPYEETADQREAIRRILGEMEKPHPMDHLLCGDVAFGKTEVAMRVAFRACWNGYQVLCVVPTTVLAQQHFFVFRERFRNFPVEIAVLSRFTRKEKSRILKDLLTGKTDILIATHSAFGEDVKFAKLGLLIIDEEHRFGVRQKETIKKRYPNIDVLSMSATPIPRTLSMAFSKILSLSIIETPPVGRVKTETFIGKYKPEIAKNAIAKEIARGGQVYYVFNRISVLESVKEELVKMFPRLRIRIAHAKMSPEKLSRLMIDFASGKFEVLLTTVIIQSGLDIPSVNTLIVRGVELLGLAQMYQLRGRIGRGMRKAYCYFFYGSLVSPARKRMEFFQEFEDLSSGFRLAMRDLELRGAGNILGRQQHGYIKQVGEELYFALLEKAVSKLRGIPRVRTCELKFISGGRFIPERFVGNQDERFRLYIRLSRISSESALNEFEEELVDRFGSLPLPVKELIDATRLRVVAQNVGVYQIEEASNGFIVRKAKSVIFFKGGMRELTERLKENKIE